MIFCLAKILRAKKLRQADNRCALSCCIANEFNRTREILLRPRAAAHLDQCDLGRVFCHVERSRDISRFSENSKRFLDFARNDNGWPSLFHRVSGTISIFSITIRLVGLLGSPMLFFVTGVSPIFSSTSSPLINFPNVVY